MSLQQARGCRRNVTPAGYDASPPALVQQSMLEPHRFAALEPRRELAGAQRHGGHVPALERVTLGRLRDLRVRLARRGEHHHAGGAEVEPLVDADVAVRPLRTQKFRQPGDEVAPEPLVAPVHRDPRRLIDHEQAAVEVKDAARADRE